MLTSSTLAFVDTTPSILFSSFCSFFILSSSSSNCPSTDDRSFLTSSIISPFTSSLFSSCFFRCCMVGLLDTSSSSLSIAAELSCIAPSSRCTSASTSCACAAIASRSSDTATSSSPFVAFVSMSSCSLCDSFRSSSRSSLISDRASIRDCSSEDAVAFVVSSAWSRAMCMSCRSILSMNAFNMLGSFMMLRRSFMWKSSFARSSDSTSILFSRHLPAVVDASHFLCPPCTPGQTSLFA
mmetsp:Transcript_19499/g.49950  ORF Transcript_19499/g.49950 Transcript_19499/m.49950 type:complete len:239 (-) Transcript_19499:178-894(-)